MICTGKFEGPEKKLEVLLKGKFQPLRDNSDRKWDKVVESSRARILNSISNKKIDAYLLSESSLFVWDDRILMITCGGTTLASAFPGILNIIGDQDYLVFYECRNFNFPHLQPSDFFKDSEEILKHSDGERLKLGDPKSNHINVLNGGSGFEISEKDETLQILMDDIDPKVAESFATGNGNTTEMIIKSHNLDLIYEKTKLDCYLFKPAGFSLNGIKESNYFTIHVTPQLNCSFVSFETNFIENDYKKTVEKIVSIFKPLCFSVILTTNRSVEGRIGENPENYKVDYDEQSSLKSGYEVLFRNYRK